ncbi:MAG: nuclear transport factor 2 family protein [Blastococcus sp.]
MTTDDDTRAAIARFDEAINDHDLDALAAAMTDDCIWEDTAPPDGNRHEGRAAVLAAMATFVAGSPNARFETEELFVFGDRAVLRWRYAWGDGHVRGVDLLRVRDGRVAESLAYVKG